MYKSLFSILLFLSFSVLIYSQDMDQASMGADYKMIYNEVLNALTTGKTDVLDKYISPDFIEHDPSPMMLEKSGLERIKEDFAAYHKVFPDMKAKVHSIAVSGDMLFAYLTFTGTTSEPYMGMPAGHKMTMNSVDVIRFKGDKAVEHWGFTSNEDIMNMMSQDKMMQKGMDKK
ncbi:MAG: ester cyclase [Ignavibacteria bacterium]|nr:ester cyclase [Ignavibacteria bacterium]